MKLMDLFEYDPKVAAALGQAAQGVGQAAQNLKGPIPLTAKLQDMETMLKDLNNFIAKKRSGTHKDSPKDADGETMPQPDYNIALAFSQWAKGIGKTAGIPDFDLTVEPDKIALNGKPNSAYVRKLVGAMIDQINKKEKADKKIAGKIKGGGLGIFKTRPEKF